MLFISTGENTDEPPRTGVPLDEVRAPVAEIPLVVAVVPAVATVVALVDASETPPSGAGTIGPPVLLESALFSRFQSLKDDQGAKALWLAQPEIVHRFACEEAEIDVDTPEDYQRLG